MASKFPEDVFRYGEFIPENTLTKKMRAKSRIESEGREQDVCVENDSQEISLRMSSSD